MSTEEKIYTTNMASEYLHITKRTLYKYIENGELKASKIGNRILIKESSLQEFIKKNELK